MLCRSETIEFILCGSLFPPDLTIRERVKHWIKVFSTFDKVEVKALEQILLQKQRLVMMHHRSFKSLTPCMHMPLVFDSFPRVFR